MKYTLANGSEFTDDGRPFEYLPQEVKDQLAAAAERILARPGRMCRQYAQTYTEWTQAEEAHRPALLGRLRAHVDACGCRGLGGTWTPLGEKE
jgi:roadblock/LC7 domain-containing protein